MEQFKFSEKGKKDATKKLFQRIILMNILFLIGGVWINFFTHKGLDEGLDLPFFAIFALTIIFALSLGTYIGYKRLKSILNSYTLTITDTEIIREQKDTPTIRHLKSEITEITQYTNGSIGLKAHNSKDLIGIPTQIENAERLESLLNQIKPIKVLESKTWLERLQMPIVILSMVLLGWFFVSKNIWVVEILGVIITGFLIYSMVVSYKNKMLDNKTRRMMYIVILPLISIIGKMYLFATHPNAFYPVSNKKELIQTDSTEGELIKTIEIFRNAKPEDAKDYDNGLITGIELDKLEAVVQDLDKADEVVVSENEVTLEIDYPLDILYKETLKASSKGFTRKELIKEISKRYHLIYADEEATAKTKTIPQDKRGQLLNRNDTDGKYGIWGHDLSDLYLTGIEVYKTKDGKIILRLNVDS